MYCNSQCSAVVNEGLLSVPHRGKIVRRTLRKYIVSAAKQAKKKFPPVTWPTRIFCKNQLLLAETGLFFIF